jgi:Family of unknown function (DUF6221)
VSDDLIAFLAARYDEAEALANAAGGGEWGTECICEGDCKDYSACSAIGGDDITIYDEGGHNAEQAPFIAANDPKHRLADIALKRAILAEYDAMDDEGMYHGLRFAVVRLATEFSGHPDYKREWAP